METLIPSTRAAQDRTLWLVVPWLACLWAGASLFTAAPYPLRVAPAENLPRPDLALRQPLAGARIRTGAEGVAPVRFSWSFQFSQGLATGDPYSALLFEIAPVPGFPPGVTETTRLPSLSTVSLTERLAPGRYFWRLRYGELTSETRNLWVE
jgi:hypothetical protein